METINKVRPSRYGEDPVAELTSPRVVDFEVTEGVHK